MPYSSLSLKQFRSYDQFDVNFSPNVNVIVGPNGSGKTNLLEALYVLSRGKSFRVADTELLQRGHAQARLQGVIDGRTRQLTLKLADHKVEKRWQLDGVQKTRLIGRDKLHVVLFEPRDMQLLTGSPERRREFVDDILEQLELGYNSLLTHYRRALTQRNALLKHTHHVPADHFFVWNVRLSELGAKIIQKRRELSKALHQNAEAMYGRISGSSAPVSVQYQEQTADIADDRLASALLTALEKKQQQDRERGFTSVGPHRDDLSLDLNAAPASTSASRGETRSLVVMLKLLEAQLLQARHNTLPLVLLDDVFGELDATRRKALATHFTDHQVIITATDADVADAANSIELKTNI